MNSGNEESISDNLDILLKGIPRENGFTSYTTQINRGSVKGDGYVGVVQRVCITGEDQEKQNKVLYLIVKIAPKLQALRDQLQIKDIFEREIHMYDKVFFAFQSFAMDRGLPSATHFAPKFYKANSTLKSEALVLEDLTKNGYVLHKRKCPMNEKHIALVLTRYAHMHAFSLVMRDQEGEKFKSLLAPMDDDILINVLRNKMLDSVTHCANEAMRSLNEYVDGKVIETYKKFVCEIPTVLDKIRNDVDEYSVIIHGDCWSNNMMFKYKDPKDLAEPSEVRLLDFQTSKLGSPALDLCYFYYGSGSKNVIDDLNYYMQLYYQNLSTYILKLGGEPEKLFPYNVLKEHWRKYAKFGLIMAILCIKAVLTEENEAIDLGDVVKSNGNISGAFTYEISNIEEYTDRLRHLILHFYDNHLF